MPESDLQLKDALGNFSTLNCVLARSVQDFIQFNIERLDSSKAWRIVKLRNFAFKEGLERT